MAVGHSMLPSKARGLKCCVFDRHSIGTSVAHPWAESTRVLRQYQSRLFDGWMKIMNVRYVSRSQPNLKLEAAIAGVGPALGRYGPITD